MSRIMCIGALLLMSTGLFPTAATAQSPRQGAPSVAMLSDEECWRRLPPTVQRGLEPLDALGSRPRVAPFGHTLMLIARKKR